MSGAVFYTVTYDANSGTGTVPPARLVRDGESITLPGGSDLSKSNYVFAGWNLNCTSGEKYAAGEFYTPSTNVTFYAKWSWTGVPYTALTEGIWKSGSLTSGGTDYYYFPAVSGTAYTVFWNDSYQGDSTKTCDIRVSAYWKDNGDIIFDGTDSGYTSGMTFTASKSGTVVLNVVPYSDNSSGTYAIKYTDGGT